MFGELPIQVLPQTPKAGINVQYVRVGQMTRAVYVNKCLDNKNSTTPGALFFTQ